MKEIAIENSARLREVTESLRKELEREFRSDTAAQGYTGSVPSSGHCAAVAVIVREIIGGEFASALVDGTSHWFNRIHIGSTAWDVDLTGDQFGGNAVTIAEAGTLYSGTRVRLLAEVNAETLSRAKLLAHRAGLMLAENEIATKLNEKNGICRSATTRSTQ